MAARGSALHARRCSGPRPFDAPDGTRRPPLLLAVSTTRTSIETLIGTALGPPHRDSARCAGAAEVRIGQCWWMREVDDRLSQAVVLYVGTGRPGVAYPMRDERRIAEALGSEVAAELVPVVHEFEVDFYRSTACEVAGSLVEMGDLASAEFSARHPELSVEAVQALAWCYTFDNR